MRFFRVLQVGLLNNMYRVLVGTFYPVWVLGKSTNL